MAVANTASLADVLALFQSVEGINQKADLATLTAAKGYALTGAETVADLIAILNDAKLINTNTAAGATAAQMLAGREAFVNGLKVIGAGDPDLIPPNILQGKDIFGVVGTLAAGRQFASGSATSSAAVQTFSLVSGTATQNFYLLTVSGLSFLPSVIIVLSSLGHMTVMQDEFYDGWANAVQKPIKVFQYNGSNASVTSYNVKGDTAPASVTATGFTVPVQLQSYSYSWLAYE